MTAASPIKESDFILADLPPDFLCISCRDRGTRSRMMNVKSCSAFRQINAGRVTTGFQFTNLANGDW